jgi:hypothetical protein
VTGGPTLFAKCTQEAQEFARRMSVVEAHVRDAPPVPGRTRVRDAQVPRPGTRNVHCGQLHRVDASPVTVSYVARDPDRIVVHGYDFRVREVVYAAAGVAVAILVSTMYFRF